MKRILLSILCMVSAVFVEVQAQKFGHFDSNAFIESLPAYKEMQKTLDAEASKIEGTVATLNEDLQKMLKEYQANEQSLSAEEQEAKQQELQESYQKIQQYVQTQRQTLQQQQQQMLAPLMQRVMRTVQEVGVENGFIYIFEEKAGLTPFVSKVKSVDITPLMKKKMGIN